jgi:hypothetical protein
MHNLRSQAGQFEHLVIRNAIDLAGIGGDAGIGCEYAFDVGVDFAFVGADSCSPIESNMSISRGRGVSVFSAANAINSSVILPRALRTITT